MKHEPIIGTVDAFIHAEALCPGGQGGVARTDFWVLAKGLQRPSEAEKSAHSGVDILRKENGWCLACMLTYLHPGFEEES